MKKASTKKLFFLLPAVAIVLFLLAGCAPVDLSGAAGGSDCSHEDGDGDNEFCELIESNPNSGSWSVPGGGYVITGFVIKAGTGDFGAVAGCYNVTQTATSVSWQRVGDGPDCKDISHVEIYYRANPTEPPPPPPPPPDVQYCRADGDPYPYSVVTAPLDPATSAPVGFISGQDIYPVPATGCPTEPPPPPPPPPDVEYCKATGSPYPYSVVTAKLDPATSLPVGFDSGRDIYPVPATGCPEPPPPPPPPDVNYCRADGDPYPYSVVTAKLDPATGKPTGFNPAKDIYPVPLGGCPVPPPPPPPPPETITLCHATGSAANPYPYVEITISYNGLHGHEDHENDIIPMPAGGCPLPPPPPPPPEYLSFCKATGDPHPYIRVTSLKDPATNLPVGYNSSVDLFPIPSGGCPEPPEPPKVTLCHATGAPYPYVEVTVPVDEDGNPTGHMGHADDIIPMPAGGCPQEPPPPTINICHANGDPYPYVLMTVPMDGVGLPVGHETHAADIVPAPVTGCPTNDEPPEVPPAPPPVATCPEFLVFHTFRDQNLEIYLLDGVEGDEQASLINLTQSDAVDCRPSRSPDDSWLVYQSDRNENVELYYTDLSGSTQIRLTTSNSNNINPMFGPDNSTIAFQSDRNGNWDIFTTELEQRYERQLTSGTFDEVNPFWSPDLRWLVFQSNRNGNWDLFVLDTQTGNEYTLVAGAADEIYPAWSPNGRQIAFLADDGGVWNLYVVDYTGENLIQITDGTADTINHTWSPEGYRIAYQSERDGNLDIFTYDLRTSIEYRLTQYAGADSGPTWDCGGVNIAFTSTRDGNPNILQVPWQGGSQSNLTIDPATDKWSQWSPSKEPASRGR